MSHGKPSLAKMCLAEIVGTYLLVLLGCGAVHASVLTGAQSGLWQVAIVWGIAIMLSIYTVGAIIGGGLYSRVLAPSRSSRDGLTESPSR